MRSPLPIILTFALTLALSLPGRVQADEKSCVDVSVEVEVSVLVEVNLNLSVDVTLDDDGNINLDWQTDKEPDTDGFNVYRADREGPYTQINDDLIQPQNDRSSNDRSYDRSSNDRSSGDSYTLVDKPGNGAGYYYMLESVDKNGKRKHRALVYMANPY